jgi:hypothetical protein
MVVPYYNQRQRTYTPVHSTDEVAGDMGIPESLLSEQELEAIQREAEAGSEEQDENGTS